MTSDDRSGLSGEGAPVYLVGPDETLTDRAVFSSLRLMDEPMIALGGIVACIGLAIVFVPIGQYGWHSILFDVAVLPMAIRFGARRWTPWESNIFKLYVGVETRGMRESVLQARIRERLWKLRWEAAGICAVPLIIPWVVVAGAQLAGWSGLVRVREALDPHALSLLAFLVGVVGSAAATGLAVSFMARTVDRMENRGVASIEGFGSVGFGLWIHGISRRQAIAWFIVGLIAVSGFGYCQGRKNREMRERIEGLHH